MMRIFLYLCFLFPVLVNAQTPATKQPKVDYKKPGAALPPFKLQNEKGTIIDNAALKANKPTVIMIFSPECDHCLHFMDSLRSLTALAKYQTLLVTEKRHDEAFKKWRKEGGANMATLFQYSGWDMGNLIYFIYTYQMLPQINIYNSKQQLVHSFAGDFPMDSLKMYVR